MVQYTTTYAAISDQYCAVLPYRSRRHDQAGLINHIPVRLLHGDLLVMALKMAGHFNYLVFAMPGNRPEMATRRICTNETRAGRSRIYW